jgi:hypothetical protein
VCCQCWWRSLPIRTWSEWQDAEPGTFSGLRPLCFSCHDGTVANIRKYAFRDDGPLHLIVQGVKGQDSDRCYDPHETGYGKTGEM